jgi:general secretion pathway protein A
MNTKQRVSAQRGRASCRFGCQRVGCDRISLPRNPPGTEDRDQQLRYPGNVGLYNNQDDCAAKHGIIRGIRVYMVAAGFGIAKEGLSKGPLLQRISEFALAQHRNGKRLLLIVDEAQNLSFEALEELRMLSNIFFDRTMALQSFLLGQPQFRATLGSPRLEQLRQRVTAAYHLVPLGEGESRAYVEHRLRRADWKGDPHFSEDCFPLIHQRTGGVPRQINTLCSRLLLFGFLQELHTLTAHAVEKVANDLREEIALVAVPPAVAEPAAEPVGNGEAISQINRRLAALEDTVHKHGRVIKRAIEIAASYLQDRRP